MTAAPLISILMPVRDAEDYVEEAVASVLAQTARNWELIAIDDGSRDATGDLVRGFDDPRIRVISGQTPRGLPARLNQAVRLARGAFFARMDGDDWSYPERLERQLAFLLAHPMVDVVATDMLVVHPDGTPSGRERWRGESHAAVTARPWSGFHFNHATWMGRAGWFRRHAYREDAWRTEDDDLLLRAYRTSRFHRLPEVLYAYRVGPIDARRMLSARRQFARALWREAVEQRDPRLLVGIPLQVAKGTVELLATGLGRAARGRSVLLGHRSDGRVDSESARRHETARTAVSAFLRVRSAPDRGPVRRRPRPERGVLR